MQYGAKGDGLTEDTAAIQAAIAACDHGSTGGGIVVLPRGKTFLSYPFNMTGNDMVLSVEGTLLGPETPDLKRWTVLPHFPSYQLSRSGHWTRYAPLVGAYNVTNLTITGGGVIDGSGAWWWANANTLSSERPRLVEPEWVKGLTVTGITLTQSMYWTLHPIYCEDVAISDIVITGKFVTKPSLNGGKPIPPYNTDGIDPDSCTNVLIENYYYCGGDDAVAVKSGWNWAGIQFNMPSKNIYVKNATSGCRGGFTIGSEMSGGVENVTFIDSFSVGQCGIRVSSQLGRGGYVRDVKYENILFTNFSWPQQLEMEQLDGSLGGSGVGGGGVGGGGGGGGVGTSSKIGGDVHNRQQQHMPNSNTNAGGWVGGPKPVNPHAPFLFHINQEYRPDNQNKTLSFFSNFSFVNLTAIGQKTTQLGDFVCLNASPCKGMNIVGLALSGFQESPMICQDVFGKVAGVAGGSICIKPEPNSKTSNNSNNIVDGIGGGISVSVGSSASRKRNGGGSQDAPAADEPKGVGVGGGVGRPPVTLHVNTNNVAGAPWKGSSGSIIYLGQYNTSDECEWACLNGPPPYGSYCCSFTFHTADYEPSLPEGWNRQCFGVINGHWDPTAQANITTGKVDWPADSRAALACSSAGPPPPPPCTTDMDCSLNGVCNAKSGVCTCRPAWIGQACQTLNLLPAALDTSGYRYQTSAGANLSSWGTVNSLCVLACSYRVFFFFFFFFFLF